MDIHALGKWLVIIGLAVAALGGLLWLAGRIPFLGNLPGDIRIENDNVSVFIPLGTMLLVSIVLTIVVNIVLRVLNK